MTYNFNENIDRSNTNALKTDGFRSYIFDADDDLTFEFEDDEFIHMWVADMDFATPDFIRDAIEDRLNEKILGYTKVFDENYYKAVVGWTERQNNWTFEKEHLVTSQGIIPALFELAEYIIKNQNEKVLILTPSYAYFEKAAENIGSQVVTSPLYKDKSGTFRIDFEDVNKKLETENIKLCFFCNPHNPTGRIWTEAELREFGNLIIKHDVWLVSDEIHCDLRRTGLNYVPFANILSDYDKLITAISHSKAFNIAGLMLSNIIIRNDNLRQTWCENHYDFENPLSIAGMQAAYEKGDEWLAKLRLYLDKNFQVTKEFLEENLPQAKFKVPEATYLAWVNVGYYLPEDVENISGYFANKAGVLLEGDGMFVDNSEDYIRLTLAMPREELLEGLQRIADSLNKEVKKNDSLN